MSPEREAEVLDRFLDIMTGRKAARIACIFAAGLALIVAAYEVIRVVSA